MLVRPRTLLPSLVFLCSFARNSSLLVLARNSSLLVLEFRAGEQRLAESTPRLACLPRGGDAILRQLCPVCFKELPGACLLPGCGRAPIEPDERSTNPFRLGVVAFEQSVGRRIGRTHHE